MKKILLSVFLLIAIFCFTYAQNIFFGIAPKPWTPGLGNHRIVLQIKKPADAIRLKITWRLHDQQPDKKRFLIINAANGDTIRNVFRVSVNNEQCDIVFGPVANKGIYYFYYLPYKPDPDAGYYRYGYLSPELPDINWVTKNHLSEKNILSELPLATSTAMQARTGFDSFYPMEIIPTATEKKNFLLKNTDNYLLFPQDRKYPIRMKDNIPLMWLKGHQKEFKGVAAKNEYFTFQIGLYAVRSDADSVQVSFSDMKGASQTIPSSAFTCFNTGGINSFGKHFTKRVDVAEGNVQALWMGVDIPANAAPGIYKGAVLISTLGTKAKRIPLQITVTGKYLADRGDSESWRYSRLRWLNSTIGISDKPTEPFTNINSNGSND
ncbi:MAG TPA: glycoside hydrolase domain-containing protein, partial [Hanamia sp.]|nr:glycoside hydrolase domain-containing protein [Hanamia sp.]